MKDLVELFKGRQIDKLYSLTYGVLHFVRVDDPDYTKYPIVCRSDDYPYDILFDRYGRCHADKGMPILFPSKDKLSWDNVIYPKLQKREDNIETAYDSLIKTLSELNQLKAGTLSILNCAIERMEYVNKIIEDYTKACNLPDEKYTLNL